MDEEAPCLSLKQSLFLPPFTPSPSRSFIASDGDKRRQQLV